MITSFEQMLLDKGYIKYVFNTKTFKYEEAKSHTLSTEVNLDYRYFHKTDINALSLIKSGKSLFGDCLKGEICFGIHESGKPPTLVFPRPKIEIKRVINGQIVIEDEQLDDSMNIVLSKVNHNEILKAMYDKSIVLTVDLTV